MLVSLDLIVFLCANFDAKVTFPKFTLSISVIVSLTFLFNLSIILFELVKVISPPLWTLKP